MPRHKSQYQEISGSDLRAIIRRAIEIDQLAPNRVDLKELYEIAAEVGISPAALEQAVRESQSRDKRARRLTPTARTIRRLVTGISATAIGWITKMFSNILQATSIGLLLVPIVPLAVYAVALAIHSRAREGHRTFQVDNVLLWLGFGIGWQFVGWRPPSGLLAPVLSWVVTAILGYVIVARRKSEPPRPGGSELSVVRPVLFESGELEVDRDEHLRRQMEFLRTWVITRIARAELAIG